MSEEELIEKLSLLINHSKDDERYTDTIYNEIINLQQRIDKAINYINTSIKPLDTKILNSNEIDTLLEILGNGNI